MRACFRTTDGEPTRRVSACNVRPAARGPPAGCAVAHAPARRPSAQLVVLNVEDRDFRDMLHDYRTTQPGVMWAPSAPNLCDVAARAFVLAVQQGSSLTLTLISHHRPCPCRYQHRHFVNSEFCCHHDRAVFGYDCHDGLVSALYLGEPQGTGAYAPRHPDCPPLVAFTCTSLASPECQQVGRCMALGRLARGDGAAAAMSLGKRAAGLGLRWQPAGGFQS
jgi:hypothetical protein